MEHWHVLSLDRIRRRIAELETRERAMQTVRTLPEGPGWVMSYLRVGGHPVADSVHIGDCSLAGPQKRPLGREQAREAMTGGGIRACEVCRPDSELGILD
ncbi:DUF6233 domain-containing protein, partial [Streptomyces sp. NPDC048350]|uniref:DUF6233 domain-containing protein n=1 Tax=Streptomyces sp. NPDC048350 TaxID=3365538 RepID=UPI0037233DFE